MPHHAVYPMVVYLPNGTQARVRIIHVVETNAKGEQVLTQLVSNPPVYERRDGTTVELDVAIPDDLLDAGWFWRGSSLHWPADDPLRTIGITTDLHPPPGWPGERDDCFTVARRFEAIRAERHAQHMIERVAKATKTKRPKQDAPAPAAVQLELF